jgi:hypothetical protein
MNLKMEEEWKRHSKTDEDGTRSYRLETTSGEIFLRSKVGEFQTGRRKELPTIIRSQPDF